MVDTMPSSPLRDAIALSRHPAMTHRRLLLFKWLMVVIPPVTVTVGLGLLLGHAEGRPAEARSHTAVETLLVAAFVTLLALVLSYVFVETLFRVLQRLQADALAREQDILTMNAV